MVQKQWILPGGLRCFLAVKVLLLSKRGMNGYDMDRIPHHHRLATVIHGLYKDPS